MTTNERIFQLNDEGLSAGKIAQKVKIKKAEVLEILGEAANKGLGTQIEKVTEATGIKAVVETVAKALDADCGCAARKEKLNKLFPNRKLNDLSVEDYESLAIDPTENLFYSSTVAFNEQFTKLLGKKHPNLKTINVRMDF